MVNIRNVVNIAPNNETLVDLTDKSKDAELLDAFDRADLAAWDLLNECYDDPENQSYL